MVREYIVDDVQRQLSDIAKRNNWMKFKMMAIVDTDR